MILAVAMLIFMLFAGSASAAVTTYYWEPSDNVNVAGYSTNWGSCGNHPNPERITTLRTGGYGSCSSDRIEATSDGQDQFLAISKTQYNTETQITGQDNALFVFRESGTYRLDLGYATGGTFTSFGYVTKSFDSNDGRQYSIDLRSITGTAPADSYLALKVSLVSGSNNDPRVYVGSSARNDDASGQFSVDEVAGSSSPTYDVTVIPSPTSAGVDAGGNFIYTITVNNNGNTDGNYNLGVTDSNSADFQASVLGSTTLSINKGASAQTTLTVTANTGVSDGQSDTTTVTATSVEDPSYSDSAQVTTTVGAPQGPSKIIVKTNRNIILDDPNYDVGGGSNDNWGSDHWNGETTMIRAYALVLDDKGRAIANQAVTFSISEITGSQALTSTNSDGIASFSYQLNDVGNDGSKTPGNYTVIADTGSLSASTTFTYSYFGCSLCHDNKGTRTNTNPKSPYITTYNTFHTTTNSHHHGDGSSEINDGKCNFCHTSYGTGDANTVNPKTAGVHSTTQNCVDCHDGGNGLVDEPADIKDCDSCHPRTTGNDKVTNFASASFWSDGMIQFSFLPMFAHQGTPAIPCVICHGPMHNTTTPDGINSLDLNTEESECTSCHVTQGRHSISNPVYCTACHSQDAHAIGVLDKVTGNSFVNVGNTTAMTSNIIDCKECHSDDTEDVYFGGLTAMSGYGYANNYDPFGKYNTIHPSADCTSSCHDLTYFHSMGEGGGGPDCLSCHDSSGSALHLIDENAINVGIHGNLNRSSDPNSICWACHQSDGTAPQNSMGDIYNTPYMCMDCHVSLGVKSGAYGAFIVDEHYPSGDDIKALAGNDPADCVTCHNKSEMKVAYTSPDGIFTNYSLISHYGKERTDMQIGAETDCFYCHNGTSEFDGEFLNPANIQITHNNGQLCTDCHNSAGATSGRIHDASLIGGGGPDCISCHDIGGVAVHLVDATVIASGIHSQLNNVTGDPNEICWGCHQTGGTEPTGMGDRYGTPYICTDCHLESSPDAGLYDAPIVAEHFKSGLDILAVTGVADNVSSCLECHQGISEMILPNSDAENGTFDIDGNGIFGGATNPYHYGKIRTDMVVGTETNCSYCHQSTSEFNGVFQDPGNIDITHDGGKNCFICHREEASVDGRIHDSSLIGGGGGACIECHSVSGSATVVDEGDLGEHININTTIGGNNNLTSEDCMVCHFDNPHSGPDATNTYYCADCHTSTGTSPIKSTIDFTDKLHGENTCTDCHVADGTYHQNDPRGSVANSIYVDRDGTGSTIVTDCADCHYASNLDDAPFNAPGGGSHILSNGGACAGSCHTSGATTMIQTVHNVGVGPDWGDTKPSITVPVLATAVVSSGTDVTVTATVTAAGQFHYADGAQYRIMDGFTEVLPWTSMVAVDGDFEGASEDVTTTFNISSLPLGTYIVEVRGMAGGPAHNSTERYYPMNGDVSSTESVTLTVQQPPGYINGTVISGVSNLSGVLVSTTGATDTTGPDGTYSLMVSAGTYTVTASKLPEYYDSTESGVVVEVAGETIRDFDLVIKPTGSISGNVANKTG